MEKTIKIPDGKLCALVKGGKTVYECPCLKEEGAPSYQYCGLYNTILDGTNNSVRKCAECRAI